MVPGEIPAKYMIWR